MIAGEYTLYLWCSKRGACRGRGPRPVGRDAGVFETFRGQTRAQAAGNATVMGIHSLTVSKWERGVLQPSNYQLVLLGLFKEAARSPDLGFRSEIRRTLVERGGIVTLYLLLHEALRKTMTGGAR